MFRTVRQLTSICGRFVKQPRLASSLYKKNGFIASEKFSASRFFSSQADRQFSEVLSEEIKQEQANSISCNPPDGFTLTEKIKTVLHLGKTFPDGVELRVEMDLAGSVTPEDMDEEDSDEKKRESSCALEARPDLKIRLKKPSGRTVLFHCSFPSAIEEESSTEGESSNLPTLSVDMVEMEREPGYYVYTDLFDDNMYDHIMRLLTERGIDSEFQRQLQHFATAEEHKLYQSFLNEFRDYCKE